MATVLITGANKGIGLEMAKLYAARGDRVLACVRNPAAAKALAELAKTADVKVLEVQVLVIFSVVREIQFALKVYRAFRNCPDRDL